MQPYRLPSTFFAQATYGDDAYGSGSYQTEESTGSSSSLANTGTPIILAGTIGVALLICAVVLFTQSRKNRRK